MSSTFVFQPTLKLNSSGNLLLGTSTDSSNGRLQLASHTTSAGGIGFGTDVSLFRSAGGNLSLTGVGGTLTFLGNTTAPGIANATGNGKVQLASDGSVQLYAANVLTLTLDSSQNATFAGTAITLASATAKAGLRVPHGAAPTSPVNGDMWTTTAGLFIRINGATVGPLS